MKPLRRLPGTLIALCAAGLLSPAVRAAPARSVARVLQITAAHAFLDAGAREGLTAGMQLRLQRGGRAAGACTVESAGDHLAACKGRGLEVGDTARLPAKAVEKPKPLAAARPVAPQLLAAQRKALLAAPTALVAFTGTPGAAAPRPAILDARLVHTTWASSTAGPWGQERLDATVRDAPAFAGFTLRADLSARRWTLRNGPVVARPDDPTQLYVWQAALARDAAPGMALQFGRVRPFFAPGATVFDGAQVGYRSRGGTEFGLYGGAVPEIATLSPSLQAGTGGAYWKWQRAGEEGSPFRFLRHEGRLAVITTPEQGRRVEAEMAGEVSLGRALDLAGQVRLAAGDQSSPAGLDALRLDASARPLPRLSLSGGFRYQGQELPERDGPGPLGSGGAGRRADLAVGFDAADWLTLSATGGAARDLTSGYSRAFAGPEVALPHLFGSRGGISAGYLEETGWSAGRSAWLQATTQAASWLRLACRASWAHTTEGAFEADELGLFAGVGAALSPEVALRLSLLGRIGHSLGGTDGTIAGGVVGTAQVGGRF